jgi:hypothetical protein
MRCISNAKTPRLTAQEEYPLNAAQINIESERTPNYPSVMKCSMVGSTTSGGMLGEGKRSMLFAAMNYSPAERECTFHHDMADFLELIFSARYSNSDAFLCTPMTTIGGSFLISLIGIP